MKSHLFRFALYSIVICFNLAIPSVASSLPSVADGGHVCGVIDWEPNNRRYARTLTNLDVGAPRTVRLIYFLPNDQDFRPEVVQRMKDEIRKVQSFYAEQMQAHGYGEKTFSIESDAQGEPIIHRIDGQYSNRHYQIRLVNNTLDEIEQVFDILETIYVIVLDNGREVIGSGLGAGGYATSLSPRAGYLLLPGEFRREALTHELGHTFGLDHDFRDSTYIMSYGPEWKRLSECSAEFLVVHPYFNPDIPLGRSSPSTVQLISSPEYPKGSESVSVELKVSNPEGLRQVRLLVFTRKPHESAGAPELVECRGLTGEKNAVIEFVYNGITPSSGLGSLSTPDVHSIGLIVVDIYGDLSHSDFRLFEAAPGQIDTYEVVPSPDLFFPSHLSFSTDGNLLVIGNILMNAKTGTNIAVLDGAISGAFSPVEEILAAGLSTIDLEWPKEPFPIKLWDIPTIKPLAWFTGNTHWAYSVAFSPDGKILAAGAHDTAVYLWDVVTQANIATLDGHHGPVRSVAFSIDGSIIASGSDDATIKLWDVLTQTNIATLGGDESSVNSIAFSADERILASGSRDDTVRLWDIRTGRMIAALSHNEFSSGFTVFNGVNSVAFSPDGMVLVAGMENGMVKLWDMKTGANFDVLVHTNPVTSVAFSPDGSILACAIKNGEDVSVRLWDTSGWGHLRKQMVPDSSLRFAIQSKLGKSSGASITPTDLAILTHFHATEVSIGALHGLEFATNLEHLTLYGNDIINLSPLGGLTNLILLALSQNNIADISTIATLTNLEHLFLAGNKLSDISVLTGLTNLTILHLAVNSISDISPLVVNTGLGEGDSLFLKKNPLNYNAITTQIPILQNRGVTVSFDSRIPTTLQIITGDDQLGLSSDPLANPFVVEVRDEHGVVFEGVPVKFAVADRGGMLSVTETTTDADGRAESVFTLGLNVENATVWASVAEIEETVSFNVGLDTSPPPRIPADVNDEWRREYPRFGVGCVRHW